MSYDTLMLGHLYEGQECAAARALESIGERWTLLIVRDAFYGVRRFSAFAAHLDIPRAVLADRLRGLVADGVLAREPDPDRAGSQVYVLTPAGVELWPVLHAMLTWGTRHRLDGPTRRLFRHAACGTELDGRGDCPTCGVTPPVDQIETAVRPGAATTRDDAVTAALLEPRRLLTPL